MTEDEADRARDQITQQLIGFLAGTGALSEQDDEEEEFLAAVGELAISLMPAFTITGQMTQEELSNRISANMASHMVRLLSAFAYLFSELAEVNDNGATMTSAELLQTISLSLKNPRAED